jgi:hypothetical protein
LLVAHQPAGKVIASVKMRENGPVKSLKLFVLKH